MQIVRSIAGAIAVTLVLSVAGCGKEETPVDKALEGTKDALDMREHEKLKDAGEDAKDAIDNAVEAVKDETD